MTIVEPLVESAKQLWLTQIKKWATSNFLSVHPDKKVVDQLDQLANWQIDFVVVNDDEQVICGVIARDRLAEFMTEKRLEVKGTDLSKISFRDVLQKGASSEYYVINEDKPKPAAVMQGLPAREILIIKNRIVKAVVDRRWFKKWQRWLRINSQLAESGTW